MAPAFRLAASALLQDRPGRRALRPVLLLITAGPPTDTPADLADGLAALLKAPSGLQPRRLALAIGRAAQTPVSEAFAGDPDCPVLVARSLDDVPALALRAGQMITGYHDERQRGRPASGEREPGDEVI